MLAEEYQASDTDEGIFERGDYKIDISLEKIDNYTSKKIVVVEYQIKGRILSFSLEQVVVDLSESEGQSSCRPSYQGDKWAPFTISSFDLSSIVSNIYPTDIDVVGNYAYIASDSAIAADHDLFIFEVSDREAPSFVSSLNTGPGLLSLHVVSDMVYAGNTSINAQIQAINISDRFNPFLIDSLKLAGTYTDGTTVGNKIFYKAGKVFLGTKKSQSEELRVIDVSSGGLREVGAFEIGSAVNDIFAFKDVLYVATARQDAELMIFAFSEEGKLVLNDAHDLDGIGSGTSLTLFLNKLFIGRSKSIQGQGGIYYFEDQEMQGNLETDVTTLDVFGYGRFVYTLLNRTEDAFKIYPSSISIESFGQKIDFSSLPLTFDCDQDTFTILLKESPLIYFITLP